MKKNSIDKNIEKYLENEYCFKNPQRNKGDFWDMFKDRTSIGWGLQEPIKYGKYAIVCLRPSPPHKGCPITVFYDYITAEEYLKERDNNA